LYCFRGGLRSQIAQQWIYEATGIDYPRIAGGYKALRRFLIEETERIMQKITPVVIGGQSGCGKTLLLDKLNPVINQECDWHRCLHLHLQKLDGHNVVV
jgi:tRNA 2-selenouridine synthase